ncbi:MAG: DUF2298 domain-containing protein [Chloroflexi bacterium]|nr:DUF2298 domain-containing protein [Chloroflexota bacterium]
MSDTLAWLLVIELMGLLGFALAFLLFSRLPDRGYTMSKALSLLLAGYLLWVLGLTGLVPNAPITIAGILLAGLVSFGWIYYRHWPALERFIRTNWRFILLVEALFLGVFLVWAYIVSEVPAINHTEKPMDFAFLTSILQSRFFPPDDPWLAGHSISYYYFGHLIMTLPMKLAGIPSNVGYNLALATLPALVSVGALGLTYNLVRLSGAGLRAGVLTGLAACFLVVVMGNLIGALEFLSLRGWVGEGFWEWAAIKDLGGNAAGGVFPESNWWWWKATRVIDTVEGGVSLDYTITEFPFFSFLLGDLHSHVLALPFAILALSLALNLLRTEESIGIGWLNTHRWQAAAISLCFGGLAFINSWDFPVYAAILVAVTLTRAWDDSGASLAAETGLDIQDGVRALRRAIWSSASLMLPLLALAVLLYFPFYLDFSSQASGILPYLGPGTRPVHFLVVIGLPALLGLLLLWKQIQRMPRPIPFEAPIIVTVSIVATAPLLLWLALALTWGTFVQGAGTLAETLTVRTLTVLPALAVAGVAVFLALLLSGRGRRPYDVFPLLLLAAAFFLLSGAELFRLADFFGNRMNTVFKVYYQAWLLLGIAGAFGIYLLCTRHDNTRLAGRLVRWSWAPVIVLMALVGAYYTVGATLDRTGLLRENHSFQDNTLDGLGYIRDQNRPEYEAILWLRDKAPRGNIVEAVGNDYSEYARVSAATGQPALLGWKGHEHQWRGSTDLFDGREEDIATIYQSDSARIVRQLLDSYDVRYIYMGHRERATYGIDLPPTAGNVLEPAFTRDDVTVYQWSPNP